MIADARSARRTIVVDLDGTLVHSDLLVENFFLFLRLHPLRCWEVIGWLLRGKAYLKQRLAQAVLPGFASLPYNKALLEWLNAQRAAGARLILATASDIRLARGVAEHLGIFDDVMATQDAINLSGARKCAALVERFGERGYEYIGNSRADLPVWKSASLIHLVCTDRSLVRAASKLGDVGQHFSDRPGYLKTLLKALRLHQWAKNILIFVPLLASHRIFEPALWRDGLIAFFAFGACASSVYLLNDLLDLQDDRAHPTKSNRPLAAGSLQIFDALALIPLLLLAAFAAALWLLPPIFAGVLACYYAITLAYSLRLKRIVMLDVVTLAMLYTVRVISGAAAMGLEATFWILAFCLFVFLSLAFVKRYTELQLARRQHREERANGRGYVPSDFELLASLGGASGYIAVLVLALYINEATSRTLYRSPQWMWLACPLLLFWLGRVWLLAHRGQMHDDPIVFALRDRVSRWTGVAFLIIFALAATW